MADIAFKQLLLKNRVKGQYLQLLYFYSKMILIITLYKIHFNFFLILNGMLISFILRFRCQEFILLLVKVNIITTNK